MIVRVAPLVALAACHGPNVSKGHLPDGPYWVYTPDSHDGTAIVHLHHSGDGAAHALDPDVQADLDASGMIGVFPMGGGKVGDDWNVGVNKDDIPRDDRAFLTAVADDVRATLGAETVWLSGFSKGGAMVYDVACLGEPAFDGFLPMSGAFQDWIPAACPNPARPIRHLQGAQDDRWPLHTEDDPESSHQGIIESLDALAATDGDCMSAPAHVDDCDVWASCAAEVRYCDWDGGHAEPPGFLLGHRDWIDGL